MQSFRHVSDLVSKQENLLCLRSNAGTHYALNDGYAHPTLWCCLNQFSVEDDWDQNASGDVMLLRIVGCYTSSMRPWGPRLSTPQTWSSHRVFQGFHFVYNEKLGPLLIVLPKDDLCITEWSMVSADMVYCCRICLRAILLVDHPQMLEGAGWFLRFSLDGVPDVR